MLTFGNLGKALSSFGDRVRGAVEGFFSRGNEADVQVVGVPGLSLSGEYFAVRGKGASSSRAGAGGAPRASNSRKAELKELIPHQVGRSIGDAGIEGLLRYSALQGPAAAANLIEYLEATPAEHRKEWLDRVTKGSCDPKILRAVTDWAGTKDLSALAQRLQMRWPSDGDVQALTERQRRDGRLTVDSPRTRATKAALTTASEGLPLCVGLSGLRHYDRDNLVFLSLHGDKAHPDAAIGYEDATLALFEVFQPDRFGPRERVKREVSTRGRILALLQKIGFEGLMETAEPTKEIGYTYATRDAELYQKVQGVIEELAIDLARMPRQRSEIAKLTESLHRVLEPTGQPLSWCEAKIRAEGASIPEEIRLSVKELRQPTSAEATDIAAQAVVAFYLLHQYVDKQVALSNCASVLAEYQKLPPNDELRTAHDRTLPAQIARVRAVLDAPHSELSLDDVRKVYAAIPVDALAEGLNRRALRAMGEGFREVPHRLRAFFLDEHNRWNEYCRGGKIGRDEFHATVYGQKIGGPRGARVVSLEELGTVRDALVLQMAHPDEKRLLRVMAPADFRAMLRDLNVVLGKMNALDRALAAAQVEFSPDPRVSPSWLHPGEALKGKHLYGVIVGEAMLQDEVPFPDQNTLTVREILARSACRQGFLAVSDASVRPSEPAVYATAQASLQRLRSLVDYVKDDVPTAKLAQVFAAVDTVLQSPVVFPLPALADLRAKPFLTPGDISRLEVVRDLAARLSAEKLSVDTLTRGERERLEALFRTKPQRYLTSPSPQHVLDVMDRSLPELLADRGVLLTDAAGLVKHYASRQPLIDALTKIKSGFEPVATLPHDWEKGVSAALGADKAKQRRMAGVPAWVAPAVVERFAKLTRTDALLISRDLRMYLSDVVRRVSQPRVEPIAKYLEVKDGNLTLKFPRGKLGVRVADELLTESSVFRWFLAKNREDVSAGRQALPESFQRFCRAATGVERKLRTLEASEQQRVLRNHMWRLHTIFAEGMEQGD